MELLNFALVFLGICLSAMGLYFEQRMFTFFSGVLFIFMGLQSSEMFLLVGLVGLGIWQLFSTFFEWRPSK